MSNNAVRAYNTVAVESGVQSRDPHGLVLMLFDGAIEAIRQAHGHLAGGRVAQKGAAIGKALRIVEEGLRASLDKAAGGALAQQLSSLYEYMMMRLLQANLRNDGAALDEVARLLGELREGWSQIKPAVTQTNAAPSSVTAATVATAAAAAPAIDGRPGQPRDGERAHGVPSPTAARFLDATYPQPMRRLATA
ncbi:MAG: flagellar export chaperone FliS [Burkholderiales bacterium]|jgi:flagellar protein FliS|nr:flagellar export chaperone FliS [Burkholderiales bacterium]